MKITTGQDPDYQNQDTLGQIQAVTGGFSMEVRVKDTFERHAQLENTLKILKDNTSKEMTKE